MLIPNHHKGCYAAIQQISGVPSHVSYWSVHTSAREMPKKQAGEYLVDIMFAHGQYDIEHEIVYINNKALMSLFVYKRY
jgi:hypothetical protein